MLAAGLSASRQPHPRATGGLLRCRSTTRPSLRNPMPSSRSSASASPGVRFAPCGTCREFRPPSSPGVCGARCSATTSSALPPNSATGSSSRSFPRWSAHRPSSASPPAALRRTTTACCTTWRWSSRRRRSTSCLSPSTRSPPPPAVARSPSAWPPHSGPPPPDSPPRRIR